MTCRSSPAMHPAARPDEQDAHCTSSIPVLSRSAQAPPIYLQNSHRLRSMRNASTIVILTDNLHPVAGTTLTGTVCLDVTPSAKIPVASCLRLAFRGEEVAIVASYMARADTAFREESKCNIISSAVTILDFATFTSSSGGNPNTRLNACQMEMPFAIHLPSWLPPTMICKGQEGSSCAIRYVLEAFVVRDDNRHRQTRPVAAKEILILGKSKGAAPQIPRPLSTKTTACEEEYTLFSLFCFPRGRMRVRGEMLPQAPARRGDQSLVLSLDVWNESKNSDVDEIEVKLRENIRWQVGTKSSMPRKEKANRVVAANVITNRQLTRAHKQSASSASKNGKGKVSPIDNFKDNTGKESHSKSSHRHIKIDISIPYDARSSYPNGTLLTVEHLLSISFQLRGCSFLTSQPELQIPLTLRPPSDYSTLVAQMNKKRPRMVRRTVYGHDMGEKLEGGNPLFNKSYLYRTYYEGGGGDEWSRLADYWSADFIGGTVELDLASGGKVGGEEDISMF